MSLQVFCKVQKIDFFCWLQVVQGLCVFQKKEHLMSPYRRRGVLMPSLSKGSKNFIALTLHVVLRYWP